MKDIKNQVENMLKCYPKMKKELLLMEFELDRATPSLSTDFIEGTVLARPGYEATFGSHVSDKTSDIVVEHIDSQRNGKYHALTSLIHNMRSELQRLEYYLSLLPEGQADVIRCFYFDRLTLADISEYIGHSQSTTKRWKKSGINGLIHYYSILDNLEPDGMGMRVRVRFISYIHEERFLQCLEMSGDNRKAGIEAMLYIIAGCNELWNADVKTFIDFNTGEPKSYAESIKALSYSSAKLLRLAHNLTDGLDWDNLSVVLSGYFPGLEYVHLELAIEALKLVLFSDGTYPEIQSMTRP